MFEDFLVAHNPHWSGEFPEASTKRLCFPKLLQYIDTKQVIAITGVRRAGKSTLVKQLLCHLIEKKHIPPHNILFINLEHPYLSPYKEDVSMLQRIYEDYIKITKPQGLIYILLDEVQFFYEWAVFVKALHETKKVRFVITGSNAFMLSSDLVTMLSGRCLALEVFPFSLRELAFHRGIQIDDPIKITANLPTLRQLQDDLMKYGGFPIVISQNNYQTAFDILGAHAKMVLLQDVAPRLGIRKPEELEKLYVYLVSHIARPFSYAKLSKLFGLSDKSIKEYLSALISAYLVCEVDKFSFSLKKQVQSPKKIYAIDTGQANAMGFTFSVNHGRLLENLILIDLKRLGLKVYYYTNDKDLEVDFVIQDKNALGLVQVCWNLNDKETRERELLALQEAMQDLQCPAGVLITAEPCLFQEPLPQGITIIPSHHYLTMSDDQQKQLFFR